MVMDAEPEDAGANQGEVDTTFNFFANVAAPAAAPPPANKQTAATIAVRTQPSSGQAWACMPESQP